MKVSELIEKLNQIPQEQNVYIDGGVQWESTGEVISENGEVFIFKS